MRIGRLIEKAATEPVDAPGKKPCGVLSPSVMEAAYRSPAGPFKLPRRGHFFAAQSAKKRRPLWGQQRGFCSRWFEEKREVRGRLRADRRRSHRLPLKYVRHLGVRANTSSELWAAPGMPEMPPVWLAPGQRTEPSSKALLAPYLSEEMVARPVSPRVGNVRNNDPSLIEPRVGAG